MLRQGLGLAATIVLVSGPALAADLGASYPAAPPPSGSPLYSPTSVITADIGLAIGWQDWSSSSAAIGINGRVNIPWFGAWNEELEAFAGVPFSGGDTNAGVFSHTYYKTQSWAGGFVLGAQTSPGGDGVFSAGIEGVVFLPNASVLGNVRYISDGGSSWTAGVEGRYYFEPNTKLTGVVQSAFNGGSGTQLTAALEHRWEGTKFSTFAAASYWTPAGGAWSFMVGARIFFDQPNATLQSHDFDIPFTTAEAKSF
jgi:hypothetical protein